jgi:hypothetical protein
VDAARADADAGSEADVGCGVFISFPMYFPVMSFSTARSELITAVIR